MAYSKTVITPVLTYWSYHRLVQSHRYTTQHFNWDRAALVNIYNNRQESCEYGAVAIQEGFARENLILTEWIRYSSQAELTDDVISQYLDSIAERARSKCSADPL